jgi:hypothetical protein
VAITTDQVIPTAPKSPGASMTTLATWLDLKNNPLGHGKGENFNVASNYQIPPARIYVINHSATRPWKELIVPISTRQGAEQVLIYDKKKGGELIDLYNVELLYRAVENGRDMNRYEERVHKVVWAFKVGGQTYAIPPARDEKTPPPRVEVREGAWDLYLGNYERMRAIDKHTGAVDHYAIGEEKARLAVQWRGKKNPVFRYTDDGVTTEINNEFGFIEFVRETVQPMKDVVDKEYLAALDLVEA